MKIKNHAEPMRINILVEFDEENILTRKEFLADEKTRSAVAFKID